MRGEPRALRGFRRAARAAKAEERKQRREKEIQGLREATESLRCMLFHIFSHDCPRFPTTKSMKGLIHQAHLHPQVMDISIKKRISPHGIRITRIVRRFHYFEVLCQALAALDGSQSVPNAPWRHKALALRCAPLRSLRCFCNSAAAAAASDVQKSSAKLALASRDPVQRRSAS